jgi:hypothetical protein
MSLTAEPVLFPSLVLSQFVAALDAGLHQTSFHERFDSLDQLVRVHQIS